jgi:diketogulonate reductase-like aldo/keto reductase
VPYTHLNPAPSPSGDDDAIVVEGLSTVSGLFFWRTRSADIAATHHTTPAAVSLAWLLAQPTIVTPIASARIVEQLAEWLPAATLTLTDDEVARLNR